MAVKKKRKTTVKKKAAPRKKKAVNAVSQITKKPPTKRLKKRRAANTKKGYFPNPVHLNHYVVRVLDSGAMQYYSGKGFTDNKNHAAVWHNQSMAKTIAEDVSKITGFKIGVLTDEKKPGKGYGENPVPLSQNAKIKQAIDGYESFTGNKAEYIDQLNIPPTDIAFKIGKCDGIMYSTNRDGKNEKYIHKFKMKSRPTLISNFDGSHVAIIGGDYDFTDRGIVDR